MHSLSHDQPQQDQDTSPQGQAHHIAPGVICRGQEGNSHWGTLGGAPLGAPRQMESRGGNVGYTWGSQGKHTWTRGHAGELLG